ncbi:hypothetical protein [Microbacterium tumbae]
MSTIDPDAVRRAEADRVPGWRDLRLPVLGVFLLPTVPAFLLPRMIANAAENDIFDAASVLALVSMVVAAAFGILAFLRWTALAPRNPALPGIAAPASLALLGVALGTSLSPIPPAWIQMPQPTPASIITGVLGIALLVLSAFARRSRLHRLAIEDEIMRSAPPVTGTVTNQGYDVMPTEASALLTQVTYAFEDQSGTRRYVRLGTAIPVNDPVVDGERVDVWFDRREPSDRKRIVVRRRPRSSRS